MNALKSKVCVVIPIHSSTPSAYELISFQQCFKVLGNHPIKVIAPEELNLDEYKKVVTAFKIIFIHPKWQSSLTAYNKLKLSSFFYDLFSEYEFLLTYELDAFVFKDELIFWCDRGYDYIGAPWFDGFSLPASKNIIGVGNSGFSLRNIKSSIRILKRIEYLRRLREFWFKSHLQAVWRFHNMIFSFKKYFKVHSMNEIVNLLISENSLFEDRYWCNHVSMAFTDYILAPVEEAVKFSFEVNPSYLFEKNFHELPFGCHAWKRYEPEFWSKYIDEIDSPVLTGNS